MPYTHTIHIRGTLDAAINTRFTAPADMTLLDITTGADQAEATTVTQNGATAPITRGDVVMVRVDYDNANAGQGLTVTVTFAESEQAAVEEDGLSHRKEPAVAASAAPAPSWPKRVNETGPVKEFPTARLRPLPSSLPPRLAPAELDLDALSYDQLYQLAQGYNVRGRSEMKDYQLREAVKYAIIMQAMEAVAIERPLMMARAATRK